MQVAQNYFIVVHNYYNFINWKKSFWGIETWIKFYFGEGKFET